MRVDRDVAQSDSRLAQEELQRFKRQELTAMSQRIHELENALTTLRHEYQELELSNRQLEVRPSMKLVLILRLLTSSCRS